MDESPRVSLSIAIDGTVFQLDERTDLGVLARNIAAAARLGAEFVDIRTRQGAEVQVLVTSISTVSIASAPEGDGSDGWPLLDR